MARKRKGRRAKGHKRVQCAACGDRARATVLRGGLRCCVSCMRLSTFVFESACEELAVIEMESEIAGKERALIPPLK